MAAAVRARDPIIQFARSCSECKPVAAGARVGQNKSGSGVPNRFPAFHSGACGKLAAGSQYRRCAMRVRVLLEIAADDGTAGAATEVAVFTKQTERAEDLGLSIAEGKALMAAVQQQVVDAQVASWTERQRCCEACGARRHSKGSYPVVFLTLYGDVQLASPRLHRCSCQGAEGPATISPLRTLIPDYVAPERLYLEARWASLVPYTAAAGLLADILPIAAGANATTLREHVLHVAERAEIELGEERFCFIDGCPADWAKLPIPEGRIVVGLDGGYVRNWEDRKTNFELIVGQSVPEDRDARYIGLAHGYDSKPKRRLFDVLQSQGLQANQDVTFLTDGGEEARALTEFITPASEHVLDWFHITMRLTVLEQYARGAAHHDETAGARLLVELERIKWLLWHGNQHRARASIGILEDDVDGLEIDYPNLRKFAKSVQEFAVYIRTNTGSLINYGERFRAGERISSCLAESTVNAVISKRFAKRQQMQWTKRGAHLLLQIRTRALDGTLRRSSDHGREQSPLHLVSAWASEQGLVLGQRCAPCLRSRASAASTARPLKWRARSTTSCRAVPTGRPSWARPSARIGPWKMPCIGCWM